MAAKQMIKAPGPGLGAVVAEVLQSPRADGMLLYRLTPAAASAGFEEGDVLVSIDGHATADAESFDTAWRRTTVQRKLEPIPNVVVRQGREVEIGAHRLCAQQCGPLAVRRGEPTAARPPATHQLDGTQVEDVRLDAERFSNAYGLGQGKRTKKGVERHRLTRAGRDLTLRSEVAFAEFGAEVVFHCESTITIDSGTISIRSWTWTDSSRGASVAGAVSGRSAKAVAATRDEEAQVRFPLGPGSAPSLFVPFLALLLPREEGAATHADPVPEDLYPWWVPPAAKGFFPLDPKHVPQTIVCRGPSSVGAGRKKVPAWRYESVGLGRTWSTTWIGDDGRIVALDRGPNGLVPCDAATVEARLGAG